MSTTPIHDSPLAPQPAGDTTQAHPRPARIGSASVSGARPRGPRESARGGVFRQAIPLGRIFGIPIGLDYSWFIVFVLLTWSLAESYYPAEFQDWPVGLYWLMGALTAVLLFVSVLLHELGHSVVAQRHGIRVRSITLFIFGGVAQIAAEPPRAMVEFLIAIAGPIVSLALAALFFFLMPAVQSIEPLLGLAKYLAFINAALVAFNLIPGFPLDGGRVFRAIVWAVSGSFRRATLIAANVGRAFAFLFIFLGVWQMFAGNFVGGLWIAFIGWFLETAAAAQVQQIAFQGMLAGHKVREVMSTTCVVVPGTLTLQQLVDEHVLAAGRRCFIVRQNDQAVGLLTLHRMKEAPRSTWATTAVTDVMLPMERMKHIRPEMELWQALQEMDRDGVNQLPVIADGKLLGMLSREDVITYLRTLEEVGVLAAR